MYSRINFCESITYFDDSEKDLKNKNVFIEDRKL